MGARKTYMTDLLRQTMSAVVLLATARALTNAPRAGREYATAAVLISISLVVTKDST